MKLQLDIVKLLRSYDRRLPVDFIAQYLSRSANEIGPIIQQMAKANIVRLEKGEVVLQRVKS